MSRHIDADALTHILESCRDTAPVLGLQSIIAVDDALQMVTDAPTVPAIPVDWIFEQMQILHELHNKNEYALQWLMELWQREQEAR